MSDSDQEKQPVTVEEAARVVLSWLEPDDRAQLAAMEREQLINEHFGLAMVIRNRLGLWAGNDALLDDCERHAGRDPSYLRHPDSASSVILERTWELAREEG